MNHIYQDNQEYFITSRTVLGSPYLKDSKLKSFLYDKIRNSCEIFNADLIDWVILDNHYHLIIRLDDGYTLGRIFKRIHGGSSRYINQQDKIENRKIWDGYFETIITDEDSFYRIKTYILTNPVKHGYTNDPSKYIHSSWEKNVKEHGGTEGVYDIIGSNKVNDGYFDWDT